MATTCLEKSKISYPRKYEDNIKYRARIIKECDTNMVLRQLILQKCAEDIIFFIEVFCFTKDPRRNPDVLPFLCYDFQISAILEVQGCIRTQEDVLEEKSRDMGATWKDIYIFFHFWRFERGSDFRVGSRKEEYVDKPKVIDTLFEKFRFILELLPSWMLPKGFIWREHSTFMKLYNPELGNAIVGESANENFGSGGRSKAILLDEFSKWDANAAVAAWTSTADVTKCRIVVSTPKGSGNKFGQLALGTSGEKIRKITLHWTLHPLKAEGAYYYDGDGTTKIPLPTTEQAFKAWKSGVLVRSPWYDIEAERRTKADLAQEVDIDFLQSGSPFFDIISLKKQRVWEYYKRRDPINGKIPYGYYITVHIVENNGKIEMREDERGWLRIYELPEDHKQYVQAGDTAEGLAKGDECFSAVKDNYTQNVVACFNGILDPEEFAYKTWLVHLLYGHCMTALENNNHGYTANRKFRELGGTIYHTKDEKGKNTEKLGWTTTLKSRPDSLNMLGSELKHLSFEVRDRIILGQLFSFIRNEKKHGKPEADGSLLDDGVITLAICGAVVKEYPYKPVATSNTRRKQLVHDSRNRRNGGIGF